MLYRNKSLTDRAQKLRKNATKQEKKLWYRFLNKCPVRFERQVTFHSYILDFYCPKAKLAIEIDGSQHYEEKALVYDKKRTAIIESAGCKVIRYTNYDIDHHFESVCIDINKNITDRLKQKFPADGTSSTIADEKKIYV